jgi:hypothetical protein
MRCSTTCPSWVRTGLQLALALSASCVWAVDIQYQITGLGTGTLNGVPFTDAPITVTTYADVANVTYDTTTFPIAPFYSNPGVTTVQIDGLGTATLTGATFGALFIDFSFLAPGFGLIGIVDLNSNVGFLTGATPLTSYDLTTSTVLALSTSPNVGTTWSTSLGNLVFTGNESVPGTFTASAVPETGAPVWVLGAVAVGAIVWRRSRRTP